jgi:hypothetical protein
VARVQQPTKNLFIKWIIRVMLKKLDSRLFNGN